MSAEHLLYAGHPEGAYALVWSREGHPDTLSLAPSTRPLSPSLFSTTPHLQEPQRPGTWGKNAHRGEGDSPKSYSGRAIQPGFPFLPQAAALENRVVRWGRGVTTRPLPSGSPALLALYGTSGSCSWRGPQRVERELLPGHPFPGEAKNKV